MVEALQSRGHVVAMTGDGVNDVLALKDADIGVAMGSGSSATRAVAQLVLLDSTFDAMPSVVGEGRRVLGNIERTSNLYVTKTVYAMLIALGVGVVGLEFPFLPRQLTLIGALTIGIPSFFLALAPNDERARPGFLARVLRFTIPAGSLAAIATFLGLRAREAGAGGLARRGPDGRHDGAALHRVPRAHDHRGAAHDLAARAGVGDARAVRARDGDPGGHGSSSRCTRRR